MQRGGLLWRGFSHIHKLNFIRLTHFQDEETFCWFNIKWMFYIYIVYICKHIYVEGHWVPFCSLDQMSLTERSFKVMKIRVYSGNTTSVLMKVPHMPLLKFNTWNEPSHICGKCRLCCLKGLAFSDKKESVSLYSISQEHRNYSACIQYLFKT